MTDDDREKTLSRPFSSSHDIYFTLNNISIGDEVACFLVPSTSSVERALSIGLICRQNQFSATVQRAKLQCYFKVEFSLEVTPN